MLIYVQIKKWGLYATEFFKRLEKKEGLSKELLADKLGLTIDELEGLEKDSSRISKETLERILALFNITYDEIILGKIENQ